MYTVECPCGATLRSEELESLIAEVQEHAKVNHDIDLTLEDVENMVRL